MSDEIKYFADKEVIREKLVQTAVKFLTNPDVARLAIPSKEQFLRSKGLTDVEIKAAVSKASELVNFHSLSSDLVLFQSRRSSWFRDNVLPLIVYGGFAYGAYWLYKNCIRQIIFVEQPKTKSTMDVLNEVKSCVESLTASVDALKREVGEVTATQRASGIATQIDAVKSEIASVKGILLNRNQFPSVKTRTSPPSIPEWQRRGEEECKATPAPAEARCSHGTGRTQRSESGGSNSSEELATKNSDSSLEIM